MTDLISNTSPRVKARITGVVYLLYFLTAVSAEAFIGPRLPRSHDRAATRGRTFRCHASNLVSLAYIHRGLISSS